VDGPAWTEQRKFCMQHLRKMGLGGDLMERIISEEVNDLVPDIKRRCAVRVYINKYNIYIYKYNYNFTKYVDIGMSRFI